MKIIFKVIKGAIIIAVILYGFYFAGSQGWLQGTPLQNIDHEQFNLLKQENLEQTKVLTEKAQETGQHVQHILGDTVEVDEDQKKQPLHERAFEYGRYLYCQQVVEDWEQQTIQSE